MVKRIFGWLLFLWMVACLIGLVSDRDKFGAELWMNIAFAVILVACALIGLMMGLGKDKTPDVPKNPPD